MNVQRRSLLASTGLLVALPAIAFAADDVVRGSGNAVTETRDLGPFTDVSLSGPFDVELRQAAKESVVLRADDNVLPLIETQVRSSGSGRTLEIRMRRNVSIERRSRVLVTVDVVRLGQLDLGGAGNVTGKGLRTGKLGVALAGVGKIRLENLEADELAVSLGGNGKIAIDGKSHLVKLSIAGHGTCDTEGLAASDVAVSIAGSGDAHVRADKTLRISIAGSGNVTYRGDAEITTSIVGSGHVRKA